MSQAGTPAQRASLSVRPTPSQPTQSSVEQSVTESENGLQQSINNHVVNSLLDRLSRCQTLGEIVRLVPAPAQERTKVTLEKVFEAFVKRDTCKRTLDLWRDRKSVV